MSWTDAEVKEIRQKFFPVTERWVFLNHAGVAPLSGPARDAMFGVIHDATVNATQHYARWKERQADLRRLTAQMIGADTDEVAIIPNTTEGVNIIASGIDWREGDNVVIPDEEFPANVYPWLNQARLGVEVRFVPTRDGCVDPDELFARCDERTRVVSVSYVEYASGFRNDLATIGRFCHERGILFFVDAIQGLGALPFQAHAWHVDALSADGHKWLLGPEGLGIFYCRRAVMNRLRLTRVGWASVIHASDYGTYDFTLLPNACRFEIGTLNSFGVFGLAASMELLLDIGIERIESRVLQLAQRVRAGVEAKGYQVYGPPGRESASGIVTFVHPEHHPLRIVNDLLEHGVMMAAREGRLRVSAHFYNTEEEIDRFLELLPS